MNKQTTTIVYALGGLALLGAAGTAIYYATKKPAATGGGTAPGGGFPVPPPTIDNKPKVPPIYEASALPLELQSFANWVEQNSHLLNQEGNS